VTVTPISTVVRPDAVSARAASHFPRSGAQHDINGTHAGLLLVVSPYALVRRGLQAVLSERGLLVRVEGVATATEALSAAARTSPSMIAVDAAAVPPESLSLICQDLLRAAPDSKIIVIAAPMNMHAFHSCFNSGILAWVCPDSDDLAITTALEMAHRGQRFVDPRVALGSVTVHPSMKTHQAAHALTRRECEVLTLLSEGCSNRSISSRLTISETTVKGHVSSILAKLGAESRLEAALMAPQLL
jgi:DNA-binding NarL/FixJ family response regulator